VLKGWWVDARGAWQWVPSLLLAVVRHQAQLWPSLRTSSGTSRQGQTHSKWGEASMSRLCHTACIHHTDQGEGHNHLPAKQLGVGDLGGHNSGVEAACSRITSAQHHAGWLGTVHYLLCGPCLTLPVLLEQPPMMGAGHGRQQQMAASITSHSLV
jgi:hypothetical protein